MYSTLAVDDSGSAYLSGQNERGALGNYDRKGGIGLPRFTKNEYLSNIVSASVGYYHSTFIDSSGSLYLAGENSSGELGFGYVGGLPNVGFPVKIDADAKKYSKISNGNNYVVGIQNNGSLWGWGINGFGQLGDNTSLSRSWPVQISSLSGWIDVSTGYQETNAIYEVTSSS
jgi:alpha-tubulin suppressor-like RCC1 family protein